MHKGSNGSGGCTRRIKPICLKPLVIPYSRVKAFKLSSKPWKAEGLNLIQILSAYLLAGLLWKTKHWRESSGT